MFKFKVYNSDNSSTPFNQAVARFKKNKTALLSMYLLCILLLIAIAGYQITNDNTTNCNAIIPEIALSQIGSQYSILTIPQSDYKKKNILSVMLFGDNNTYQYFVLNTYSFTDSSLNTSLIQGSGLPYKMKRFLFSDFPQLKYKDSEDFEKKYIIHSTYILGADNLGRDIFSRILLGLRISLSVGFIAVLISLLVGISLGSIAGYSGGIIDAIIQWIMNVIWAIPTVLLVFALTILLGKGFWQIFLAVGLTTWVGAARIVRGQVMQLKQMEYIEAARSLGFNKTRIIVVHILPNILGPIMVVAASNFATAILLEAGLSFLGIGVQAPTPSWGAMIKDNYGYIISDKPFLAIVPGLAIMILVLLLNLVGNGLRDAMDVKTKN
jgi:peptide/nickel transport system permease protein